MGAFCCVTEQDQEVGALLSESQATLLQPGVKITAEQSVVQADMPPRAEESAPVIEA